MKPGRTKQFPVVLSILLAIVALGCDKELRQRIAPNQAPDVRLNRPVAISTEEQAVGYAMSWKAQDQDGRVDHYLYALDPASVDRVDATWIRSSEPSATVRFGRRASSGAAMSATARPRDAFHVFAVRAVDDQGLRSATATLALFEDNIAPTVLIENPAPDASFMAITTINPTITWRGTDEDGHIVRYKYRLFQATNPDFPEIADFISLVRSNPDTLRGLYGPNFASWDSAASGATSVQYTNLAPNQIYLFAITAVDNRGAYDPIFSPSRNVLVFAATDSPDLGPQICVTSPNFNYCQASANSPAPTIEIPAGTAIPVSWVALPPEGAKIVGYRWAIDPPQPLDDSRGTWGPWSLDRASTTVGPFNAGGEHALFIQAKDTGDLVSTLKVPFVVIASAFEKDLLIVDDTRLTPDNVDFSGGYEPPRGPWPTAAELDTFLYARGGFPWRQYPEGTFTVPGILAGYDFDTLGTRGIASGIVPLSVLSRYRHVLWITDDIGAVFTGSPVDLLQPITSLRLMSSPGFQNTLAAYAQHGGQVWLQGGGAAYATLAAWNRRNTPANEFTNVDGELIEGRFMYDFPHWQSGIRILPAREALLNVPATTGDPTAAPGRGWPGQPLYQKLATHSLVLSPRNCVSDPPPPLRTCNSFYAIQSYTAEFLFRPNAVLEDVDPRPNHETFVSVLDTLYLASGGSAGGPWPVMTYYHGSQSAPMVFSGFPIWYFQRQQCQEVSDFVLQDIWGLSKRPAAVQLSSRATPAGVTRNATIHARQARR